MRNGKIQGEKEKETEGEGGEREGRERGREPLSKRIEEESEHRRRKNVGLAMLI